MSENLKEVIAKLKAQSSQQSKQVEVPKKLKKTEEKEIGKAIKETVQETEDFDEIPEEDEEEKKETTKEDFEKQQAIELELLQNNGRFRVEFLYRLNGLNHELKEMNKVSKEINQALIVIANILVENKK